MDSRLIILLLLVSSLLQLQVGCATTAHVARKSPLVLYEDKEAMRKHVEALIPIGSSVRDAEEIFADAGFKCTYEERKDDGRFLYADLQRPLKGWVSIRWQILIFHNDQDAVTGARVNIGYIGP